ncbi:MAG: hypothetical protein QM811_07795 [Pirellulales bacterium]
MLAASAFGYACYDIVKHGFDILPVVLFLATLFLVCLGRAIIRQDAGETLLGWLLSCLEAFVSS